MDPTKTTCFWHIWHMTMLFHEYPAWSQHPGLLISQQTNCSLTYGPWTKAKEAMEASQIPAGMDAHFREVRISRKCWSNMLHVCLYRFVDFGSDMEFAWAVHPKKGSSGNTRQYLKCITNLASLRLRLSEVCGSQNGLVSGILHQNWSITTHSVLQNQKRISFVDIAAFFSLILVWIWQTLEMRRKQYAWMGFLPLFLVKDISNHAWGIFQSERCWTKSGGVQCQVILWRYPLDPVCNWR